MAVLDSARYHKHLDLVMEVAPAIDRRMAAICATNCLVRMLRQAEQGAAAGPGIAVSAIREIGAALVGGGDLASASRLLAACEEHVEGGTRREVLWLFLSGVVDLHQRLAALDHGEALVYISGLPFNLLDLLEDSKDLDAATVARCADREVVRQVRDLELALDGLLVVRSDERLCD